MRCLILLLAVLFLIPMAQVQAQENKKLTKEDLTPEDLALLEQDLSGVLRGFVWGLPPTVILENERGTFMGEEEGALLYLDYISGIKSTIAYEFNDNKFWKARVFVEKKYRDPQDQIRDLMLIAQDLTNRFGEPIQQEFNWRDETEKNFPDNWGWALYRSELFIRMAWQNDETIVMATAGAERQYDPELIVTYIDRATNERQQRELDENPLQLP